MLLVALGYNTEYEGIGGSTWEITTNSLANLAGLYEGLETINPSEPLTRDNAAQMIYNVLNANVVSYTWTFNTNGNTVAVQDKSDETLLEDVFGVVIVEGVVTANEFASLGTNSSMDEGETRIVVTNYNDGQTNYGNPESGDRTATFKVSTGEDVLGRSVALYVQPSTTAANSASRATVLGNVVVSSDNTVVTDLSSDSIAEVAEDNDLSLVETTENVTGTTYTFNYDASTLDELDGYTNEDEEEVPGIVGQGVEKTLIDNDDDGVAEYVFVNRFDLGKVTRYSTDGDGAIVVRTTTSSDEYEAADVVGFDDVARNDYVLTAVMGGKLYVEVPETVTGTLELYRTDSEDKVTRLTVDGTEYHVSNKANVYSDLAFDMADVDNSLDAEATFYLDRNGYIVGMGDVEETAYSYAFVLGGAAGNSIDADRVKVALPDGTIDTYDLDESGDYVDYSNDMFGKVYRYSINSDGEIRLSAAYPINVELAAGEFENGRAGVTVDGETYYTTANTLFFYSDDEADAETGAYSDVDVYTGYNNVPNINADGENSIDVYAVTGSSGYSIAVVIYVDDNVSISGGGGTSSDFILAYDYNGRSVDSDGNTYYSYDAFVNGVETDIDSTASLTVGVLYTDISYDDYGYIDDYEIVGSVDADDWQIIEDDYMAQYWSATNNPSITSSGSVVTIGADGVYSLADDYDIYVVDVGTGDYDSVSASRLESKYDDEITTDCNVYALLDDDGYVYALFIVGDYIVD